MPRRKLPSPDEYGRRLAEARRREEKRRREAQKRSEGDFTRVFDMLERHMRSLESLEILIGNLDKEVLSPLTFGEVTEGVFRKLAEIQTAIENIDLEIPEMVVPELPLDTLGEIRQAVDLLPEALAARPVVSPEVSPSPPETILAGPVTLKVTGRDNNGDIDEVRVEPTRH